VGIKKRVSRRAVVRAGAALGVLPLLSSRAVAAPLVRYSVASAQGQAMLAKFSEAVKRMAARDAGYPLSWTFQWFTHHVHADSSKERELARLAPERRALAAEMWDTCQAHGGHGIEEFFLPWHRIYLYYFERIVRTVLADPTFTMPYWNYTDPAQRALPVAFCVPASSSNSLYRKYRRASVNRGRALDEGQSDPSPLNLGCLDQENYLPTDGVTQGFCLNIDQGLHATVHVLVGDRRGMGDITWSANDPIFWLHHSNIDRLWASWNEAHDNPDNAAWREREFIFADEKGVRIAAKVGDFLDIGALGYGYDQLERVMVAFVPPPLPSLPLTGPPAGASATVGVAPPRPGKRAARPAGAPPPSQIATASGPVAMGASPVKVELNAPQAVAAAPGGAPETAAPPRVGARPQAPPTAAAPPSKRLYIVIRNLQAHAQPGVLYNVYLEVAGGRAMRLGTINFFDAGMNGMMSQKFASFDITGIVDGNIPSKEIGVTIAPVGKPASDAQPVIGDISLVSG